jgi:hypothetical protein
VKPVSRTRSGARRRNADEIRCLKPRQSKQVDSDRKNRLAMPSQQSKLIAALSGALLLVVSQSPAFGQAAEPKQPDPKTQGANDPARIEQRRLDEFAEAARVLGGPAANPECVWLGRRVVNLLWRDDLDTAFRHLDLFDRFGCPGAHIQATFRCLVRQGNIDPKAQETLNGRVHACWLNPGLEPVAAEATPAPAATSGGTAKP